MMTALCGAAFIWLWRIIYNPLTVFPYYFKGFVMMFAMYLVLMAIFIRLLGGMRLPVAATNVFFYLVTCLLSTYLVPVWGFLFLTLCDILVLKYLEKGFDKIFDRVFPELKMLLIYGDHRESEIRRMTAGWGGKYRIESFISINRGRHNCIKAIAKHDAVVICDIPVEDRNVIAEYCQDKNIPTYFTPRLSDFLFRNAGGLMLFDGAGAVFGRPLTAAQRFSLLGYLKKIYKGSGESLYEKVNASVEEGRKEFIITANPETLMNGLETEDFDSVLLREETLVIPDGIGLIKALSMAGYGHYTKIPGVDFAKLLLKMADVKGLSVFLYGASEDVVRGMRELMKKEYRHAKLLDAVNGYDRDPDEVMEQAVSMEPDIMMVALGVPAQEILISKYFDRFKKGIFIGVGGSFDVLSGKKKRAPGFFLRHNLEWLYRIVTEPVRIKRFLRSNVRFIREVMRIKSIS